MKKKQRKTNVAQQSEEEPTPESEAGSFGSWLRRQREVREIGLREIADASKIGVAYLEALEDNRFDGLPADVFIKGFLRQYAKYVGLDQEEVVNYYLAARQADKEQEEELAEENRPPRRTSGRKYMVVILLLAGLLVLAVWWLARLQEKDSSASPPEGSTPQPAAATQRPPVPPAQSTQPATSTAGVPQSGSGENAQGSAGQGPADQGSGAAATGAAEAAAPLRVVLDFTGDCWVEASTDGERTLAEMRVQGESVQLDAQRDIALKVGDFNKVRVEVNGEPYDLAGPGGGTSSVRNVVIDLALAESLQASTGESIP